MSDDAEGKFVVLTDLGEVTVPAYFRLSTFGKRNRMHFWHYDKGITDQNYPNPSRILKSGNRLRVQVFRQIASGVTTTTERIEFCSKKDGCVFVGAQGIPLVFEQKRAKLPRGFWYASLDARDRLWKDSSGCYGIPNLVSLSAGGFDFDLGCFERPWDEGYAFFLFLAT